MPRCSGWFTSIRCLSGEITSSIDVTKATKPPTVVWSDRRLHHGDRDHDGERDRREELRQRLRETAGHRHAHRVAAQALAHRREAVHLVLLAVVHLDDLVAADRLFDDVRQLVRQQLMLAVKPAQPAVDLADQPADRRQHHRDDQRQTPVQIEQVAEQEDHRQRIAHQRDQHARQHVEDLVHLEDDRVDHRARGFALEERGARVDHAVEHLQAQIEQDLVRHVRRADSRTRIAPRCAPARGRSPRPARTTWRLSLAFAPKPLSSSGLSKAGIAASVAALTAIATIAPRRTQIRGLIYGHSRLKTTAGDDASPEPMGLLNVGFALKESSEKAGQQPRGGWNACRAESKKSIVNGWGRASADRGRLCILLVPLASRHPLARFVPSFRLTLLRYARNHPRRRHHHQKRGGAAG